MDTKSTITDTCSTNTQATPPAVVTATAPRAITLLAILEPQHVAGADRRSGGCRG
jgi:hypothetical protein